MKKVTTILFILLYLLPAIGFSLDFHKCGKKIRVVSINAAHENKCPCGSKMPFNCCKDVHISLKLSENQKNSSQIIIPGNIFFKHISYFVSILVFDFSAPLFVFDFTNYHAPPFKSKQPVYLTNNVFII